MKHNKIGFWIKVITKSLNIEQYKNEFELEMIAVKLKINCSSRDDIVDTI